MMMRSRKSDSEILTIGKRSNSGRAKKSMIKQRTFKRAGTSSSLGYGEKIDNDDSETLCTEMSSSNSSLDSIEVRSASIFRGRKRLRTSLKDQLLQDYAIQIQSIVRGYLQRIKYRKTLKKCNHRYVTEQRQTNRIKKNKSGKRSKVGRTCRTSSSKSGSSCSSRSGLLGAMKKHLKSSFRKTNSFRRTDSFCNDKDDLSSSLVEDMLKNHNKKFLTDRILKTIKEEKSAIVIQAIFRRYIQRIQYCNKLLLIQNPPDKELLRDTKRLNTPRRGIKRLQKLKQNLSFRNARPPSSFKFSPDRNLGILFRKREEMLISSQAIIRGYLQRRKNQRLLIQEKLKQQQQQRKEKIALSQKVISNYFENNKLEVKQQQQQSKEERSKITVRLTVPNFDNCSLAVNINSAKTCPGNRSKLKNDKKHFQHSTSYYGLNCATIKSPTRSGNKKTIGASHINSTRASGIENEMKDSKRKKEKANERCSKTSLPPSLCKPNRSISGGGGGITPKSKAGPLKRLLESNEKKLLSIYSSKSSSLSSKSKCNSLKRSSKSPSITKLEKLELAIQIIEKEKKQAIKEIKKQTLARKNNYRDKISNQSKQTEGACDENLTTIKELLSTNFDLISQHDYLVKLTSELKEIVQKKENENKLISSKIKELKSKIRNSIEGLKIESEFHSILKYQ